MFLILSLCRKWTQGILPRCDNNSNYSLCLHNIQAPLHIAMVNFMSVTLDMLVKQLPEQMRIWIGRQNKADWPFHYGWTSSDYLRAWVQKNKKAEKGYSVSLSAGAGTSVSCPWCSCWSVIQTWLELHHQVSDCQVFEWHHPLPGFSSLQTVDQETSQPPWSCEPVC